MKALAMGWALDTNGQKYRYARAAQKWGSDPDVVRALIAGDWDGAGIASPGAAVAADGTVIIGWAGENSPSGGINRQIGTSTAPHPLGPFTKGPVVASAAAPCTTAPQPCPEHALPIV